jgi:NAD dependent epimerase/dehydratase family enzyme
MNVVVAGGTGFLGRPLSRALAAEGHDVVILTRGSTDRSANSIAWTPDGESGPWASAIDGAGVVVNLAGESIAAKRWTTAQKEKILGHPRCVRSSIGARQRIRRGLLRSAWRRSCD